MVNEPSASGSECGNILFHRPQGTKPRRVLHYQGHQLGLYHPPEALRNACLAPVEYLHQKTKSGARRFNTKYIKHYGHSPRTSVLQMDLTALLNHRARHSPGIMTRHHLESGQVARPTVRPGHTPPVPLRFSNLGNITWRRLVPMPRRDLDSSSSPMRAANSELEKTIALVTRKM